MLEVSNFSFNLSAFDGHGGSLVSSLSFCITLRRQTVHLMNPQVLFDSFLSPIIHTYWQCFREKLIMLVGNIKFSSGTICDICELLLAQVMEMMLIDVLIATSDERNTIVLFQTNLTGIKSKFRLFRWLNR